MILALADDLTGALEAGAKFAQTGIATLVTTRPRAAVTAEALVIDTETRHLTPEQAAARIADLVTRPARIVYKKTDSTLRGNIGAELAALHAAFPGRRMLFIPAYPEMGRTVRDGHLYVHGELLHTTAFARDPLNPMSSSRVCDALQDCAAPVEVIDAATEQEVSNALREALQADPPPVFAGPANVAGHLAQALGTPRAAPSRPRPLGRVLVVNGSLHPISAAQLQHGRSQAWPDWTFRESWEPGPYDTIVIFGGDTAYGILERLGITELTPIRELVPGIPLSRAGELQFITKAGGFGSEHVLTLVHHAMSEAR